MRYFQLPPDTRFYPGVDLHARSLFLVVLDCTGQTGCARTIRPSRQPCLAEHPEIYDCSAGL
jgi:hypothetical protein